MYGPPSTINKNITALVTYKFVPAGILQRKVNTSVRNIIPL